MVHWSRSQSPSPTPKTHTRSAASDGSAISGHKTCRPRIPAFAVGARVAYAAYNVCRPLGDPCRCADSVCVCL